MAFHNTRGHYSKAGPSTGIPGAINFNESDSAPVPLAALGLASPEHEANPLQEEPQHSSTPLRSSTPVHVPTPPVASNPTPLPTNPITSNPTPLTSNPTPLVPPFTSTPPVFPPPLPSLPFIRQTALHQVPQNTAPAMMPPTPAGIDPAMWASNQAFVMSLIPALQAIIQPPAAAPPAPVSHPKEGDAKALTPFSGDDPTKLREFLFECGLIFDIKPRTFQTEKSHVIYAINHLDGMAKRHFRRFIEAGSTDPKVNYWAQFSLELETIFGDPDRIGRASDKLLALKMSHNSHLHRYTVLFKEYADELGWPNVVLRQLYYNGLPTRLKDVWTKEDPPADFDQLVSEAQQADNRYWKHEDECKKSEAAQSRNSDQKGKSSSSTQQSKSSSSSSKPSSSTSKPSSSSSTSKPSNNNSRSTPSSSTKDLTKILGSDGKLLPAERARREQLGLCTYCGGDHKVCPIKPSKPKPSEDNSSSNSKPSTSSTKSTNNTSNGSKPKGRVAQVVISIAEESEPSEDSANTDF